MVTVWDVPNILSQVPKIPSILIKRVLLAEAQHRRLHSAFEKPFFTFVGEKGQNVYRQEEEPEEAEAAAGGEDGLLHVNTIEDCELRSLLIS